MFVCMYIVITPLITMVCIYIFIPFSYPDPASQFPNGKSKALVGDDTGSPRIWVVRHIHCMLIGYCEFLNQSNQRHIRLQPEPSIFRWDTEKGLGTRMLFNLLLLHVFFSLSITVLT